MKVTFNVTGAQWNGFGPGQYEIKDDEDAVRLAVAGEAAGAGVEVVELDAEAKKFAGKVVEDDEASIKNLEAAMADGSWAEGNAIANGEEGGDGE